MDTKTFMDIVSKAQKRDIDVLEAKGLEYSVGGDRLGQFYKAAVINLSNPVRELMNMATKQFTSLVVMCDTPGNFPLEHWKHRAGDLRNYMHLLEGLLLDIGVE